MILNAVLKATAGRNHLRELENKSREITRIGKSLKLHLHPDDIVHQNFLS
jgi:hypothetical protein